MASSMSVPQLLIPEGEINEILCIINSCNRNVTKRNPARWNSEVKIVGNLFGLWRNSLTTPVVQLVTGPGKNARISSEKFSPDFNYHKEMKHYMETNHGLLQIGLWCAGSVDRYPRLDRKSDHFDPHTTLLPTRGKYVVLLFLDQMQGNLRIEYHIINRERPQLSQRAYLTEKDVLPGTGGFRLLGPVSQKIKEGEIHALKRSSETLFKTGMLQSNHEPQNRTITAVTVVQPVSQWYESEEGSNLLRKLVESFKSPDVHVEMSRDQSSCDIDLDLNHSIRLHFPADFPETCFSISWLRDKSRFRSNYSDDICRTIFNRATNILSWEAMLSSNV